METISRDAQFLIGKLYPNSTRDLLPGMTSTKSTHSQQVLSLFETLPKQLTSHLYFAFQPDFDMFGYSLEDF